MNRILLALALTCLVVSCVFAKDAELHVVATTSHLGCLVSEIGRDRVDVKTLVPGGACPGHFDIDPASMKKIADADLFMTHDWEKRFDWLLKGSGEDRPARVCAKTEGNWMVPEVNMSAADEVAGILAEADPANRGFYERNAGSYKRKVISETGRIKKMSARFIGLRAVCSAHQEEFLKWLGFEIAAVYGRGEDLSIKEIAVVMKKAKAAGAVIVADNLQSGADAGLAVAKDLKIPHVTLTNFPKGGSYLETLEENAKKISEALK
ncbi:MAG: metal ABC transporter substrate-binding protein [Endomicrobiales bacterium]|nr:metal ABC transporter substrate-binding protein [Endomicrobiales bacterium]